MREALKELPRLFFGLRNYKMQTVAREHSAANYFANCFTSAALLPGTKFWGDND
ncbi:MAG: hypothetical protein IPP19_11545 [Verrucomicrobia bacterium]|nr:hypothetical protein [Verrucomicrobiota bacterium]